MPSRRVAADERDGVCTPKRDGLLNLRARRGMYPVLNVWDMVGVMKWVILVRRQKIKRYGRDKYPVRQRTSV